MLVSKNFKDFSLLLKGKPLNYIKKQFDDILCYRTTSQYPNVSDEVLEKYTPFRRLSKKNCSLSDPKYFINQFEKNSKNEIPKLWDKMTDESKIDFIVKNRYEKLVANKIMNDIKDSKVEKMFALSTDGKIKYASTQNSSKECSAPLKIVENSISIHNHPRQFIGGNKEELAQINKISHPFSATDYISTIFAKEKKSYVVDFLGTKYQFIPNYKIPSRMGKDFYLKDLKKDLEHIEDRVVQTYDDLIQIYKMGYIKEIERIKQDGHEFKILNFI